MSPRILRTPPRSRLATLCEISQTRGLLESISRTAVCGRATSTSARFGHLGWPRPREIMPLGLSGPTCRSPESPVTRIQTQTGPAYLSSDSMRMSTLSRFFRGGNHMTVNDFESAPEEEMVLNRDVPNQLTNSNDWVHCLSVCDVDGDTLMHYLAAESIEFSSISQFVLQATIRYTPTNFKRAVLISFARWMFHKIVGETLLRCCCRPLEEECVQLTRSKSSDLVVDRHAAVDPHIFPDRQPSFLPFYQYSLPT